MEQPNKSSSGSSTASEPIAKQQKTASPRYKLVIDTTADDSILRALQPLLSASTVKLSHFSEDSSVQQINAISAVKWAAEKGEVVLLSQTESINESFYDLFNQHYIEYGGQRYATFEGEQREVVSARAAPLLRQRALELLLPLLPPKQRRLVRVRLR